MDTHNRRERAYEFDSHLTNRMSNEYPQVVFIHVDIDMLPKLPDVQEIRREPTFKFYKNQNKITETARATEKVLRDTIVANLWRHITTPSMVLGLGYDC